MPEEVPGHLGIYFGAPMRPVVEPDCPELAIDSVEANRFGLLV